MMWNFKNYAENTVIVSEKNIRISYQELQEHGEKLAKAVGKRCLVFCLCTNQPGSLLGYTAFINNRIVPLLLDSHMNRELLLNLIETYRPSYMWIPSEMEAEFSDFVTCYNDQEYVLMQSCDTDAYVLHQDLALLLTTSGSTGSPKLVRQSYKNILENARSIAQYLELDETERAITTLPMNYTYGLSVINSHLLAGASILLTEKGLMQKEFWQFLQREKATSFAGVPYTYEMLEKLRFFQMELPSLRTMTQAGGKLSPYLHKKFAEYAMQTGRHFVVMYGQTEATARMAYLPWQKSLEKYGSMGIAIPGGQFMLVDENGNEIMGAGVVGELIYKGQNVTLGYAECGLDLQKGDTRNGRLETGDMAERDEDGYYYIAGRKKRFLKIFGNRVNLDEIDRMVKERFQLLDFACTGVDDHLYLFATQKVCLDEIRIFLAKKTGLNPLAFHSVIVEEIPKNEAGKILYKELEKYYEDNSN